MSVTIISNEWNGESSTFTIDQQGKVIRRYTQKRLVTFHSQGYNWDVADELNYEPGQPHESDANALLVSMDMERQKTRSRGTVENGTHNLIDLTLVYSTDGFAAAENSDDPTLSRVNVSWGTSSQMLYAVHDRNGDLIVNAANQPFEGGVPVSLELPTLIYERNELSFDGATATAYSNSLNSDFYAGADPKTLRLKISGQKTWSGVHVFWKVRYEMAYYWLGWQPQPVNAGLKQLVGGVLTNCFDDNGMPVTSPVPLTTAGARVPTASLPSGANFITVDYYRTFPFGSLALPLP